MILIESKRMNLKIKKLPVHNGYWFIHQETLCARSDSLCDVMGVMAIWHIVVFGSVKETSLYTFNKKHMKNHLVWYPYYISDILSIMYIYTISTNVQYVHDIWSKNKCPICLYKGSLREIEWSKHNNNNTSIFLTYII